KQWPLKSESLQQAHALVAEQLSQGHIKPSTSPWNTPIFVIKKTSGKFRLLHDLRAAINAIIEPMGGLQPGLPSSTMIPFNWPLVVLDLEDWFFTISLHPDDAPWFAFSVPALNHAEPIKRFHWTVLPQGMCNSPTICQRAVDLALQPVCRKFPDANIYHYMDDILRTAHDQSTLCLIQVAVRQAIQNAGLIVAPEMVQPESPWHYLGWRITQQTIIPQPLMLCVKDPLTLNELQKLLGSLNWLHPVLGLSIELLHPLFDIIRGNSHL
ncbi:PO113 protein, partial [Leptocoma aspasia]|nr:PO113 protein [Leptocoma aspasia]